MFFSLFSQCFSLKKGVLPIAEYEGSPRRFGHYQQDLPNQSHQHQSMNDDRPSSSRVKLTSPTLMPRPGFPQVHDKFDYNFQMDILYS